MNTLSNVIHIIPLQDVTVGENSAITLPNKSFDVIPTNNDLILEPKPKNKSGNIYYEHSLKVLTDKLPTSIINKYKPNQPVVVLLFDDKGETIIWGNTQDKVRVTIKPYIDAHELILTSEFIDPLF